MCRFIYLYLFFILVLCSCNNKRDNSRVYSNKPVSDSVLENAHKEAIRKENIQISDFLNRYKWDVNRTGTGLIYYIYDKHKGTKIQKGDIVVLDYTITFLNGDTVYSSDIDGRKEFQVGRSNEISGLEEGLMLLTKYDKARLIVPSFLAYGLTGDFNKISINNTLIYDIEVVDIY